MRVPLIGGAPLTLIIIFIMVFKNVDLLSETLGCCLVGGSDGVGYHIYLAPVFR